MNSHRTSEDSEGITTRIVDPESIATSLATWEQQLPGDWRSALAHHPRWLIVLRDGLQHVPYAIEATCGDELRGLLPLAFVQSALFGRFLVSLPYLNSAGVIAQDEPTSGALLDAAVRLADQQDVRYLELRHEQAGSHTAINYETRSKVYMRLALPESSDLLWDSFKPKVRNQVRKGEKSGLTTEWGQHECLDDFYRVFSINMRDLGTPVFSKQLFASVLEQFPQQAEICLVRLNGKAIGGALLTHGTCVTEVPSASTLRAYNSTNANMLMYWHLLLRAIERGQSVFDFGRSSADSNTYRFKKQWGALPAPAVWQYMVRRGEVSAMRPESSRNQRLIRIWKRLPVGLTRMLGPAIVRGIP